MFELFISVYNVIMFFFVFIIITIITFFFSIHFLEGMKISFDLFLLESVQQLWQLNSRDPFSF